MSNNNGTNYFNDLSNSDMLFINILNSMYNDNLRIVHHLIDQNTQIRNTIIGIMNNRRSHNISNNTRNNIRTPNRNRSNNENVNLNDRLSRLYIVDNIPFYLDTSQINTTSDFNRNSVNNNNSNITNNLSRILSSFLDPVNIVPTQVQIENATRNITYGDILDPINSSCPISLEQFTDSSVVTMIRHCRHIFNTNSLMAWFNNSCKCPICRYDIRNYNSNNSNRNNNTNNVNINNNNSNDDGNNNDDIDGNNDNDNNDNSLNNDISENNNPRTHNNRRNNAASRLNYVDSIFDVLNDLSGNNILEYSIDDASALFTLLYPQSRRSHQR
jgi:hypothetical protein